MRREHAGDPLHPLFELHRAVRAVHAGEGEGFVADAPPEVHPDLFRRPLDEKELARFEAIVLDPPRAGAKEQIALLARSAVPRIAYVSCNPATFARDAQRLVEGGYSLEWVKPVGQFRWSTHVELVGSFARTGTA
ncbi:MAG: hypothetical protein KY468_15520 [Armatimonadetes bacterium]|nr:hypothetical protein [Armatimonadota bacterium]